MRPIKEGFVPDVTDLGPCIIDAHEKLLEIHGPQGWWPARHSFEICVGSILVQNTAWSNAYTALQNLRDTELDSIDDVLSATESQLADRIRPSGYYNKKAATLWSFCEYVTDHYSADLTRFLSLPMDRLRAELLGVSGIGDETADVILLYAARQPSFIMDTYTVRFWRRIGIIPQGIKKPELRRVVMAALPGDVELYAQMHALIIQHSKRLCTVFPHCSNCALAVSCDYGHSSRTVERVVSAPDSLKIDYWTGT